MNRIICINEQGFRKIALPNGSVIDIQGCDNGCLITTKDMKKDIKQLNEYEGLSIYEVCLDSARITKGTTLGKCKITKHPEYGYECINWVAKSIAKSNASISVY